MTKPRRLFVDGTYGQIHVRQADGSRTNKLPLVCLHMFPQSGRNFEKFLQAASEDRTVIAPDFPGYGESDQPPTPISATEYAKSVWEVVDQLDLLAQGGRVDLFGIHAGAKLATEAAHQRPQHVNKMVLSSAAVLSETEVESLKKSFTSIPLDKEGTRFVELWGMLTRNRGPGVTYPMLANGLAEMLRGGEGYEWGHQAVFEYNKKFPEVISSLPHEIALLNPRDDLYEMTPRTIKYIKNGSLHDYPEWGHGFLEVHAHEVASTVDQLLSNI